MELSPLAEVLKNTMRQTCTVYRYGGADPTGQPIYSQGIAWPCRIAIRTERGFNEAGDYITNSTVNLLLPANCEVGAYDMVDLPAPYQQGAIIREVITATDLLGRATHQAVRIA